MQAIILATDEQPRLPPLTDGIPAPLLPVLDRPVMVNAVEILARAGFKQILVSLHHRGGPIAAYFGSGQRWGVNIEYVTQREARGSAGALKWAASLLTETFLVLPGDSIIDLDIEAALAFHRSHGGLATAILHRSSQGNAGATVQVARDGRIIGLGHPWDADDEIPATGAYILEPDALGYIPTRSPFDLTNDLLPDMVAAGKAVFGYEMNGYWNSLDSVERYQEAQQVTLYSAFSRTAPQQTNNAPTSQLRFPSISGRQIAPGIWVGLNDSIHPSVKLAAPVYIGANCWIGREVELGAGTVIGSDVVVDDEATLSHSTVLRETYVGRLVKIENRIVNQATMIDPLAGECTFVTDPFLLSRVGIPTDTSFPVSRVFNGLIASCLLAILSPLVLLTWLMAFIGSGGRPFVRRPCVGERFQTTDGKEELHIFQQVRFRTRKADGTFALMGRFIERWELHRLPELVNVIRGDMALVGVKPLAPEDAMLLIEDWQQRRYDVPAGFTGLWYLQTAPSPDLDTVLVADVYYVATRSWRSDLLILFKTVGSWLRGDRSMQHVEAPSVVPGVLVERVVTISHSEMI